MSSSSQPDPLRFAWHIPGILAGSAHPARLGYLYRDVERVVQEGVRVVINISGEPLEVPPPFEDTLRVVEEPVEDGAPPSERQMKRIRRLVEQALDRGEPCLVHCRGGVGRTATVIAALLMELRGMTRMEALQEVRKAGRWTQSVDQWVFLERWEAGLRTRAASRRRKRNDRSMSPP